MYIYVCECALAFIIHSREAREIDSNSIITGTNLVVMLAADLAIERSEVGMGEETIIR